MVILLWWQAGRGNKHFLFFIITLLKTLYTFTRNSKTFKPNCSVITRYSPAQWLQYWLIDIKTRVFSHQICRIDQILRTNVHDISFCIHADCSDRCVFFFAFLASRHYRGTGLIILCTTRTMLKTNILFLFIHLFIYLFLRFYARVINVNYFICLYSQRWQVVILYTWTWQYYNNALKTNFEPITSSPPRAVEIPSKTVYIMRLVLPFCENCNSEIRKTACFSIFSV